MKDVKKIGCVILTLALLLSLVLTDSTFQSEAASGKWKHNSNGYYYVYANGTRSKKGWKTIGGKKYYFNAKGYRVIGWKKIGGKKYHFTAKGVMQTGWHKISGKKYYFGKNGAMVTGWKKIGKKKYYFSAKGVLNTKTTLKIKGITYRFRKDGSYIEKTACSHNWVWETHTEKEWVPPVTHQEPVYDDGWTEYIYKKMYKCGTCGKYFETMDEYDAHASHSLGGYSKEKVIVDQIYHEPEIIDYDTVIDVPGYWNEVVVKDYQYCSKCGKKK